MEAKKEKIKNPEDGWKVIYVSSRQEKVVTKRLFQESIECFLPLVKRLRSWSDRKKWVELPLFNGYLIVRPDEKQYDKVLQTPGVVGYVRFDNKAAIVRNDEVEIIRRMIENGYDLEAEGLPDETRPGTPVRVAHGPLAGYTGEILETKNGRLFHVIIEGMNQGIKIKLPAGSLELI